MKEVKAKKKKGKKRKRSSTKSNRKKEKSENKFKRRIKRMATKRKSPILPKNGEKVWPSGKGTKEKVKMIFDEMEKKNEKYTKGIDCLNN